MNGPRTNVGDLIRSGLVLQTREAMALVYEVCSHARTGSPVHLPQAADDLSLSEAGELQIAPEGAGVHTPDARIAAAALLEALLPSNGTPEDDVPAALRSLPARLRASASAVPIADHRDLLAILRRYLPDDPRAVLRRLIARSAARSGDQPAIVEPASDGRPVPQPVLVPLNVSQNTLALFDSESKVGAVSAPPPSIVADPDVFRVEGTHTAIVPAVRRRRTGTAWIAGSAAMVVLSGYAGYTYSSSAITWPREAADLIGSATQRLKRSFVAAKEPSAPASSPARRDESRSAGAIDPDLNPPAPPSSRSVAVGTGGDRSAPAASGEPAGPPAEVATDNAEDAGARPLGLPVADGAFSPSFAPTGRALFFHSGRSTGRLLEAELDDRGTAAAIVPVLATPDDGEAPNDYHPRLSPDGRLVAFDSDRDGERGVYVSNPGGVDARRVSGEGFAAVPSWSPDMKWLAFVRAEPRRPRTWNLWLRDVATGTLTQYTSHRVGQVWGASWFPDSRRLCYSHEDRLVIADITSGSVETFDSPRRGRLVRTPAVSPDGRRIVFQVHRDGVWMLDLETRSMRRILDDPSAEEFAWDPQGKRIAFHSRRDGQWRIWMTTPPRS